MKFFGSEKEIEILRDERKLSHRQSRFTVVTGRRRVGKTELVRRALNDGTDVCLYLLLTRQSEKGLCQSLQRAIREQLGDLLHVLGHAERVSDLIREVVRLAKARPLTLIIDEFQEMEFVNPGFPL